MKTIKQQLLQEYDKKFGIGSLHVLSHYTYRELQQFLSDCIDKVEKETIKKISSLIEKSRGNDYHNIGIGELDYHEKCAVDAYVITLQSRMKKLKSQKGDR